MRQFKLLEEKRIQTLTQHSVEMTYLELTETGLKKSIMDATVIVRQYLFDEGVHNFSEQGQGEEHKKIINAHIITGDSILPTKASLYRPKTKMGDPRIWIYKLNNFASPGDIICIVVKSGELFVFNLTKLKIERIIESGKGPLFEFVKDYEAGETVVSAELLNKLKAITRRGPIRSIAKGDTGIGRTLEDCLGIKMNSDKNPDYKGIELKSFRSKRNNRKSLFTKVPDWNFSKFKSIEEILNNFGYTKEGIFRLYCTVNALKRNPQSLMLKIDDNVDFLLENSNKGGIGDFVAWQLEGLKASLQKKHKETFWIEAHSVIKGGNEYFDYSMVEHTKNPVVSQLVPLIEQGDITLDHLIKRSKSGKISEKGPAFKIKSKSIKLLFPDPVKYKLK